MKSTQLNGKPVLKRSNASLGMDISEEREKEINSYITVKPYSDEDLATLRKRDAKKIEASMPRPALKRRDATLNNDSNKLNGKRTNSFHDASGFSPDNITTVKTKRINDFASFKLFDGNEIKFDEFKAPSKEEIIQQRKQRSEKLVAGGLGKLAKNGWVEQLEKDASIENNLKRKADEQPEEEPLAKDQRTDEGPARR